VEALMKCDTSFNGKLNQGVYGIWCPMDNGDAMLNPVATMNNRYYPSLIVSGQYTPGTPGAAVKFAVRLEVCINYEFTTTLTCFDTERQLGAQAILDMTWNLIKSEKMCRENSTHLAWLRAMTGKVASFYQANKAYINPLMMAAVSTLL
jgi:hypothetical protein